MRAEWTKVVVVWFKVLKAEWCCRQHNLIIICSHPRVKSGRLTVWNQFRAPQELFSFSSQSHYHFLFTLTGALWVIIAILKSAAPWYSLGTLWCRYSCHNNNCLHSSVPRRLEGFYDPGAVQVLNVSRHMPSAAVATLYPSKEDLMLSTFQSPP